MQQSIRVEDEIDRLEDHWSPRVIARVDDHFVKVAKLKGSLAWHRHDGEDEMFMVVAGSLKIELENRPPVELRAGELFVVPRGVLHNPIADEECHIILFEAAATKHTGNVITELTRSLGEQLRGSPISGTSDGGSAGE